MIKRLTGILLLGLLAACTPTSTVNPTSTGEILGGAIPTQEGVVGDPGSGFGLGDAPEGVGFVAEIDGDVIDDVVGAGSVNCENNVYVVRAELTNFPQIALILPQGATTGTFDLVDNPGDGSAASATIFFEDGRVFATRVNGLLVVNALATSAGGQVSGNFDFSASSDTETVNARGEFDFVSSDQAVYCP